MQQAIDFHCGTDHLLGALAGARSTRPGRGAPGGGPGVRRTAPGAVLLGATHLERARNFHARGRPDDTDKVAEHASAALDLARTHGLAAVERRASEFIDSLA